MEFWGVEVKAGEPLTVSPEEGQIVHVSQVALGEVKNKKGANYVPVRIKIDDKNFIIGTLSAESRPQLSCDLVFEKDFELSHDWKDGSLYFCGYTADDEYPYLSSNVVFSILCPFIFLHCFECTLQHIKDDSSEYSSTDESDDEENIFENGKLGPDVQLAKPTEAKTEFCTKSNATLVEPKNEDSEDDLDESDEDFDDESDDSDLSDDSDDETSEDEDEDKDEDEETPKKAELSKKRPLDSATETPVPAKKSKSDGKNGSGHKATPHPSKQDAKKTALTPKSSGQVSCKSCSKTFNSENALESHSKAKHGGK